MFPLPKRRRRGAFLSVIFSLRNHPPSLCSGTPPNLGGEFQSRKSAPQSQIRSRNCETQYLGKIGAVIDRPTALLLGALRNLLIRRFDEGQWRSTTASA